MHLCNSDDLSEIELPEDLDEVHNIMITEIKERVESTYKIWLVLWKRPLVLWL